MQEPEFIRNKSCPLIVCRLVCAALLTGAFAPRMAWSQTPSPMQEWQYSG
jgi:hypothetical protein